MELEPVYVLSASLLVHAIVVGALVVKAAHKFNRAMSEVASGIYERGERPEQDYPLFDEELAKLHLDMGEDINYGAQLTLEYDPVKVDY